MYLLVIFFPFAGFATVNLLGRFIGNKGSGIITTLYLFLSFILSCLVFVEVGFMNGSCHVDVCTWLKNELLIIN
jgi:NADH:ubiquinone oxidoreductase subunit 5 (subunit L)/multisubunit Na+/H+ antiporter MnhA subunit